MQVLEGRLASGNRYRITPYVILVTDDTGGQIQNVDVQALGDSTRRQNVLTCWMRDGSTFNLRFASDDEAIAALTVIQDRMTNVLPTNIQSIISPRQIAITLCAIGVVIGSIGPWAKIWIVTADGLDGDGQITVVMGLAALVGLFLRMREPLQRSWIVYGLVVVMGIAALIGGYDWQNIDNAIGELDDNPFATNASVAWGLQLMTITAVIGTAVAFAEALDHFRRTR